MSEPVCPYCSTPLGPVRIKVDGGVVDAGGCPNPECNVMVVLDPFTGRRLGAVRDQRDHE